MSLLDSLTAKIPFLKSPETKEYFFALNIGLEKIKVCVWAIEASNLKIINPQIDSYSTQDEILDVADKLLDKSLGMLAPEPEKILFGVPDSFLVDEELKEPYLNLLQQISKSLSLAPMAYVATSHAISHMLDKTEGGPTTAILVDIGKEHILASVIRAGKADGSKLVTRGDDLAQDVEKALLSFTDIEVLPSRILIYSSSFEGLDKQKDNLVSFSWMNKLPFLHIPKIDILDQNIDISGVALAGAVEIDSNVKYNPTSSIHVANKSGLTKLAEEVEGENVTPVVEPIATGGSGFVTGDIEDNKQDTVSSESQELIDEPEETIEDGNLKMDDGEVVEERTTAMPEGEEESNLAMIAKEEQDLEEPQFSATKESTVTSKLAFLKFPPWLKLGDNLKGKRWFMPVVIVLLLLAAYLILPQAKVIVYVEPKVLEKDAQVIADPNIKQVNEEAKKIPGQVVEVGISGSDKASATGSKQVGDPAKGTVKIINNSNEAQTFSAGSSISASGVKFTFDSTVKIASTSATADNKSTATASVTANLAGADGNLPSGTQFSSGNSQVAIVAEGNFSGGTSKEVKVVTDEDQKKLLASLAASLRKQAQQQLQGKLKNDQKILEEALSENITKKSYSKNIGDQANEFTLNLNLSYKGIAYSDADLKSIVAKLVDTNIPEGYQLDLNDTETQADVSKMENNQLIFLARFKAKLAPKLDLEKIKQEIKGQSPDMAAERLRAQENVLESDIQIIPALPAFLARLPILPQRIQIEVRLK